MKEVEEMEDDAWKQYDALLKKFTQIVDVRSNIQVIARATDRGVELVVSKEDYSKVNPITQIAPRKTYTSTGSRNVSTMRELAQALMDACDFVDEANPIWASKRDFSA